MLKEKNPKRSTDQVKTGHQDTANSANTTVFGCNEKTCSMGVVLFNVMLHTEGLTKRSVI